MKVEITVEDQLAIARRGAAPGDANGQETIGVIYLRGAGVPNNSAEAFKWFRKAAEQGDALRRSKSVGCTAFAFHSPKRKAEPSDGRLRSNNLP